MKLRILLINPWICDFAAYNLWARPLGLLKVAEYLSSLGVEIFLIDCTNSFQVRQYGAGRFRKEEIEKPDLVKQIPRIFKRYGISPEEFIWRLKNAEPFDLVMMTSIMSYWYPGIQQAVLLLRERFQEVPIILGGIYATLYPEHASSSTGVNYIYRGALNNNLDRFLAELGFVLNKRGEQIPYYQQNFYSDYPFAPLLTSKGCPFACSYCAIKFLNEGYQKRPLSEILKEIRELKELGVCDFAFYDDALLVDPDRHIKPLLRSIIEEGYCLRFHTPNGLHAYFLDQELAWLMKKSGFKTIRLSLETVNEERQSDTGGKVNNEDLKRAVFNLKEMGFTKEEIGVYLMYGLPGQDLQEVKEGIKFLKTLGVRIQLTEFSPIRGTRCWQQLVEKGIIPDNLDPLLTNNTVFYYLYSGYDPEEVKKIKLEVKEYNRQN